VITSIAPYTGRRATAVYARDVVTGQVIRCEVFIDKLSSIKISHHSLKIDLDGLATLRIHGFDVEGMS
jgi:nuclear pore complex protein Nup210